MRRILPALLILALWVAPSLAEPLRIVAVTGVYADIARQLAPPDALVSSLLNSRDQDPHEFQPGPATARALAGAHIVIHNGGGYDPWMPKLLSADRSGRRQVVAAADALHLKAGDNPHVWFDPGAAPVLAAAITAAITRADPANAPAHAGRLAALQASLVPLDAAVAAFRARHQGVPVTATEPVLGPMTAALGLAMRNERYQLAVMNETEPRPSDVAGFEADLRGRRVRALIHNIQVTGPTVARLLRLAASSGIPVVPVTETKPDGVAYQAWMLDTVAALDRALSPP